MLAPGNGGGFADYAVTWSWASRKPLDSLEDLVQQLPATQREEVRTFLREQEVESIQDLAAVTANDLTEVFKAQPEHFTIPQRSAVRGLRTLVQEQRQEVDTATAAHGALWSRWAARGAFILKFLILVALGFLGSLGTWAWITGLDAVKCDGPAGDGSGLKVIVASFDGSPTQPVLDTLTKMGLRVYNSQDFSFSVWSSVSRKFWKKPENGGLWRPPFPRPSMKELGDVSPSELWGRPTYRRWSSADLEVLNKTSSTDLAAAVSRCNVEVVALDGIERLFWPLFWVSRDVKVISLGSIPFEDVFNRKNTETGMELVSLAAAVLSASQYVLPWGVVYAVYDVIYNYGTNLAVLVKGAPGISQASNWETRFVYTAEHVHRVRRHAYGGLNMQIDRRKYNSFFWLLRKSVPSPRLLEFDPARSTWEDLCKFVDVSKCPKSGPVPLHGKQPDVKFDLNFIVLALVYLFFWFVNWQVISFVLPFLIGPCRLVKKPMRAMLRTACIFLHPRIIVKMYLGILVASYLEAYDMLRGIETDAWNIPCNRTVPEMNASNLDSGIQVLVAGFAKSGTRTMSRTLFQAGLEGSYHSEELLMYWWGRHANKYWERPENGGEYPGPSFSRAHDFSKAFKQVDMEVLRETSDEEMATGLRRCGVQAIAFDALEQLFWPIYNVSPNTKVISLNWRTYDEHQKSMMQFATDFRLMCTVTGYLMSAVHGLPWGTLHYYFDWALGGPVAKQLREGRPAICQELNPFIGIYHSHTAGRLILQHWYSGLMEPPTSKAIYDEFYDKVRRRVPKDRLMEWDMRKHKWEDLCDFLNIKPCPRSGNLERAINVFNFERDFPVCFLLRVPFYLLLQWCNWQVYGFVLNVFVAVLSGIFALLTGLLRLGGFRPKELKEAL